MPIGTPVPVTLNSDLSTATSKIGDLFDVTVTGDVSAGGTVIIPKGAIGHGEVLFTAGTGGFGRAGYMLLALRTLDLSGKTYLLNGHYRVEGRDKNGATAATYFAVGIFSGFIKGKTLIVPKGSAFTVKTGEDIAVAPAPPASPAVVAAPSATASTPDSQSPASPPPGQTQSQ